MKPVHSVLPRRNKAAAAKSLAGIAAALIAGWSTASFGAVSVNPNIEYFFGSGPGEGVSVSSDGKFIMVSSPVNVSGETNYSSSVPHLVHNPLSPQPFNLTRDFALTGFGEVTDVGVMPGGPFGLAVVRADALRPFNGMLAIRGDEIVQTIPIPKAPDGMKISPDGRYAIVAVEKGGDIRIYDLQGGAGQIEIAAIITKASIAAYFVNVQNPVNAAEPEAVGISADSSFALVTIQDCASLASLSLDAVTLGRQQGLAPEAIGDLALKKVLHLPFGFKGRTGTLLGVEPDGVGISPDGTFAILAHEANNNARHLAGISVIDLRNGLANMTAQTYSIFDIDPTLLANTGLVSVPIVAPGDTYPTNATLLPRLDPASVEIVNRGGQLVAAVVIERYDPSAAQLAASTSNETRGSVLFLDVGQALNGIFTKIDRLPGGVSGSRMEVIDSAQGGRWIFVSISNGGGNRGTFARFELLAQ